MIVSLIWAMSQNRLIGHNNRLPWHLPDELQYFKECTTGTALIMGRKTFESLPAPLPNRLNIVLTRSTQNLGDVIVVDSLNKAFQHAKHHCATNNIEECFVIGGATVYSATLPLADRLYVTTINVKLDGDTYFPDYDESRWRLISESHHQKDSSHDYSYDIRRYKRHC